MMGRSLKIPSAGFTLLEVMIVLAVMGGLLVTLIQTLNYHLGIAERHEFITIASMLAKGKMNEMEEEPESTEGEFQDPYRGYHYVTEIRESLDPELLEVAIVVGRGKEEVTFYELIKKPE
jgi:general secretion pathway protein I